MTSAGARVSLGVPAECASAKAYVIDVVFGQLLDTAYEIHTKSGPGYEIAVGNGRIRIADDLLSNADGLRHETNRTPTLPLKTLDATALRLDLTAPLEPLPVLFGRPHIEISDGLIECDVDIFGSIFFMLSRYEELAEPQRDQHGRFPASASLAFRAGFLERPIVDDYVALLFAMIRRLEPAATRPKPDGKIRVSCDVDHPFDRVRSSARRSLKALAGDLVSRRSVSQARDRLRDHLRHRHGDHRHDLNYTFEWYADICANRGHRVSFYFIPDHTAGAIDGDYSIEDRSVLRLIRTLAEGGHEIGTHGSYNSFQDAQQIARERRRLQNACTRAGVETEVLGNRQHYLRWDSAQTPGHLDRAGYEYDSTGGFADAPGFRFGTAHKFSMWCWITGAALNLKQQPLIVMDTTLISPQYLGLETPDEAFALVKRLKQQALSRGGDFTLLWHNSNLKTARHRRLFQDIID